MSRQFPGAGTTDYLETTNDVFAQDAPQTFSLFFLPNAVASTRPVGVYNSGGASSYHECGPGSGGTWFGWDRASGDSPINTLNPYNLGAWNHGAFVLEDNNKIAVLNGDWSNRGTLATLVGAHVRSRVRVGLSGDSTPSGSFDGLEAWVALYAAALTRTEIEALAMGANPRRIRRNALKACWPLWGVHSPEMDVSGNGNDLTIIGTVPRGSEDPPIAMFRHGDIYLPAVSQPAAGMMLGL